MYSYLGRGCKKGEGKLDGNGLGWNIFDYGVWGLLFGGKALRGRELLCLNMGRGIWDFFCVGGGVLIGKAVETFLC